MSAGGDQPIRLSLADQALINLCGFLACHDWAQDQVAPGRVQMVLDEMPALLPAATARITLIARLVLQCRHLLERAPHRKADAAGAAAYSHAREDLRAALAEVMMWRAGLALDALRSAMAKGDAA